MSRPGQDFILQEVRKVIEYCAKEYDMTWAEAVGCLSMIQHYYSSVAFQTNMNEEAETDEDDFGYQQ